MREISEMWLGPRTCPSCDPLVILYTVHMPSLLFIVIYCNLQDSSIFNPRQYNQGDVSSDFSMWSEDEELIDPAGNLNTKARSGDCQKLRRKNDR